MVFTLSNPNEKSYHNFAPCDSLSDAHNSILDSNPEQSGYTNYNIKPQYCQASNVLEVCNTDFEVDKKFKPKKQASVLLSDSYKRLGLDSKSQRVADCGSFLDFAFELDNRGSISERGKLHNANFCRDRLCPMCSWRKSLKIFSQVSTIMSHVGQDYRFIFLTLTVPNVDASELSPTITRLMKSFDKLNAYKAFKTAVKGFFRALEITRNKVTEQYHPHFHCILVVNSSYANSRDYISRDQWLQMWRKAYKDDSIMMVDVRFVKPKSASSSAQPFESLLSAVAEATKYSVKSKDYIFSFDPQLMDRVVSELSTAMRGRRLTAYGGLFKQIFEKLQLDDAEEGDLIHINDNVNPDVVQLVVRYGWSCGCYKVIESFVKVKEF